MQVTPPLWQKATLEAPPLGLATCEGDQVRQAEAVGQDDTSPCLLLLLLSCFSRVQLCATP